MLVQTEKPLEYPYLPEYEVKKIIINENICAEAAEKLKIFNIEIIHPEYDSSSESLIAGHPDVNICPAKGKLFVKSKSDHYKHLEPFYNIDKIDLKTDMNYKSEAILNCLFIGKYLICNRKTASKKIIDYAKENEIKIIHVNQGYTKCSICPVDKNAVITDDYGIHKALENQFDVLLINKGEVKLKGFEYGFFGGCTGKISKNKLAINGSLNYLKDKERIVSFLSRYNVEPIELFNGQPEDIGSLIPVSELCVFP
ncbi:MAG: hypothetical protein K6B52_05475 [Clostridiales bacterium]|nr:hypothetical protein [Clostridiales bacterium]